MAISRDKKNTLVADLTELLNDSKMVVYAKYEGLTVAELQELRKLARESGVKIKVVKNRLVKVAMKEIAAYKNTDVSALTGQLLYAVGSDEDFDAAKVLAKFAKTHAKMELVGGFNAEGTTLSTEEVKTLGSLPSKNELIAQVVDTLLSGINGIVSGLEEHAEKATA
ncbi:50S ribosomal protein L10 [Candidatus Saccharibacteria bacterium]|jgi:large subunit ribosomal protein L10|nr:50S ribosomal protein L10 [Candidatus Saccharibacteria bacterium]